MVFRQLHIPCPYLSRSNGLRNGQPLRTTANSTGPTPPRTQQTRCRRYLPYQTSKYIILLLAPTSVAGKVQIATSVSKSLSCPLIQGDSLHESSAKAAAVGASRDDGGGRERYQRMWFSKMTRTGLLFPEESRPANEGFYGFGGGSFSTSTSRRGSESTVSSTTSFDGASTAGSTASSAVDVGNQFMASGGVFGTSQFSNRPRSHKLRGRKPPKIESCFDGPDASGAGGVAQRRHS